MHFSIAVHPRLPENNTARKSRAQMPARESSAGNFRAARPDRKAVTLPIAPLPGARVGACNIEREKESTRALVILRAVVLDGWGMFMVVPGTQNKSNRRELTIEEGGRKP